MSPRSKDHSSRLATIVVADIVGYSSLMCADEEGTYAALRSIRDTILDPGIENSGGRVVKHLGDGFLAEFPTVLAAVQFAITLQEELRARNEHIPAEKQLNFRVGINLGDIIVDSEGDVFGDGVNVAARLEALAPPGGICVSAAIHDLVNKNIEARFEALGEQTVKNISTPVRAYILHWSGEEQFSARQESRTRRKSFLGELRRRNVFRVAIAYLAAAWLLTEVASTLFPIFDIPDWGVRFIVAVFAIGFIPALLFSWAYELTPEGLKREKDVLRDNSIKQVTAKRLDKITISLILVALAIIAAEHLWLGQQMVDETATAPRNPSAGPESSAVATSEYPRGSIAVLPFVNMSDDPANEYFSDGISEELLNLLATLPELRVTARTSSFFFKGKDVTIAEIARELKVAHVLEGSVRKDGDRVRVTAQLIETGSGTHLWSETYDRTLEDIFAIQDEIAGEVVRSLKVTLLGETAPKARETDPEAFSLYLQCRHFSESGGAEEGLRKAERYCRQSLAIDPDYAPSWEALSTLYTNLAISGYIEYESGYEQAINFNRRAIELDPNLASAQSGLGWYAMMFDRNLRAAAPYFRKALALAPGDSRIVGRASVFAETLGRFDRAIELADEALALNPLSATVYGNIAVVHCFAGQFDKAAERFDKAFELLGNDQYMLPWRAKCHLLQHQPDEALAAAEQIELESRRLWILPMALHDLGQHDASDQALGELIRKYPNEAASFIAENYAWRGEVDPAFEWLNRAIEEKQYMWGSLVFDPAFGKLHTDPRWRDIRARDGRSEELLQEIEF